MLYNIAAGTTGDKEGGVLVRVSGITYHYSRQRHTEADLLRAERPGSEVILSESGRVELFWGTASVYSKRVQSVRS